MSGEDFNIILNGAKLQFKMAEQKAAEEAAAAEVERLKKEAELKAIAEGERLKKEEAEAIIKAKADQEAAEAKRIAEEAAAAARLPDKEKVLSLRKQLLNFSLPDIESPEAKKIVNDVEKLIQKIADHIDQQAKFL